MEMITRKEAQAIANYSRAHFQRLINAGMVPAPVARHGRSWMYDRASIVAFAATKKPATG